MKIKISIRLILIFGALIFGSVQAEATDYYFDNTVSNYSTCSIGSPCTDFPGTTLDNTNALSCGDTLNFKRGGVWTGTAARIVIESGTTACANNPIYIQAYGTGARPKFADAAPYSGSWTYTGANNIWYTTGQSSAAIRSVYIEDDDEALYRWSGSGRTNSNLPEGTMCRSTSTTAGTVCGTSGPTNTLLFIRLRDGADPNTKSIRIATGSYSDNNRGLVRSSTNSARGKYLRFRDIEIINSNTMGLSISGTGDEHLNIKAFANGKDGILHAMYLPNNENCENCWGYYPWVEHNPANGTSNGQGITLYSGPYNGITGGVTRNNAMAGLDVLKYHATEVNPQYFTLLRHTSHHNGQWQDISGFDPNIYFDGPSDFYVYGLKTWGSGSLGDTGTSPQGGALNARSNIKMGSEHPATVIMQRGKIVNFFSGAGHWKSIDMNNLNDADQDNIEDMNFYFGTQVAPISSVNPSGSATSDLVFSFQDLASVADTLKIRYNIIVRQQGTRWVDGNAGCCGAAIASTEYDWNVYYARGTASSATTLFRSSSVDYNLAAWQTLTGFDANSIYGNPGFDDDQELEPNYFLSDSSPAIDACDGAVGDTNVLPPSWVPQTIRDDIGAYGIRGSTVSPYVEDDVATNPDCGFHQDYALLTNTSVVPSSTTESTNVTLTVNFTIPRYVSALVYDWDLKLTVPAQLTLNSGGTSAATAGSNISGTFSACTVNGQTITCPRAGDGNSEFPNSFTFTISNVGLGSAGATGTFSLETVGDPDFDGDDETVAWDTSIEGFTIDPASSPTCFDGIQNQDETGIDCGGAICNSCESGGGGGVTIEFGGCRMGRSSH